METLTEGEKVVQWNLTAVFMLSPPAPQSALFICAPLHPFSLWLKEQIIPEVVSNDTGKIKLPIYWMEETICLSTSFGNKSSWRWHVLASSSSSPSHVLGGRRRDVMSKGIEINWRNINAVKTNLPLEFVLFVKKLSSLTAATTAGCCKINWTNLKTTASSSTRKSIHKITQPIT